MLHPGARVHFIGISGTGLSAIATVLLEQGYGVSGCDQAVGAPAEALVARGVHVYAGHDAAHLALERPELVVVTSAAPPDHAEVAAARAQGLPVLKRADLLGALMAGRTGIAVAGTHGKTTTTGMISYVLARAGLDPTFIAGGTLRDLGVSARAGQGAAFVIEADEYDRMFLGLRPQIAVITNVEHDHPDLFPTYADVQAVFGEFAALLPPDGLLVACADDPGARALGEARRAAGHPVLLYGLEAGAWRACDVVPYDAGGSAARVEAQGRTLGTLRLALPGRHNVLNALAALAALERAGVPFREAAPLLASFHGMGRRFELHGEAAGVTVVDDYGHHPSEIRATLAAARARFPGRPLWAVWQPHTYTRTRALLDAFAEAFADAAHVIVADIYASREHDTLGLDARAVAAALHHEDVQAPGGLRAVADYLLAHVAQGDVVLVFSAGDGPQLSEWLIEGLRARAVEP